MTFSKTMSAVVPESAASYCNSIENPIDGLRPDKVRSDANSRQVTPIKDTFLALGLYARDNPGHRRQVGLVISSMKDLARCPESSGLRRLAATHAARLAELRQMEN